MADTPLFEQSQETTPGNLSDRLAYGRSGVPTKNITWTNIVAWLNTALAFLKSSNNLSDVDDVEIARTNLDVLDSTTINNALDLKADKTNVLEKDNTTSYTPTQDFHPATKKSSEDAIISKVGKLVYSAYIEWNGATITPNVNVNLGGFISGYTDAASETLRLNLAASDNDWLSNLEILTTQSNGNTGLASELRTPRFWYESNAYIAVTSIDSAGNRQDDGKMWIRIYDWS